MYSNFVWGSLDVQNKAFEVENYTFLLKPWFHPSSPSETMMKESASHHMIILMSKKPLTTCRGYSLWILCVSTGNLTILVSCDVFSWLRGSVFWMFSDLHFLWSSDSQNVFLELPGIISDHSGSILEISNFFPNFIIFDIIFATFSTAELSSHPLELEFIFSGTWRSF